MRGWIVCRPGLAQARERSQSYFKARSPTIEGRLAMPIPGTTECQFDCVNSAICGYETSRRPRTARVRLPMATSAVKT